MSCFSFILEIEGRPGNLQGRDVAASRRSRATHRDRGLGGQLGHSAFFRSQRPREASAKEVKAAVMALRKQNQASRDRESILEEIAICDLTVYHIK